MSTPSQPQHRIFISHSHIDNEFGTRLAQDLRRVLGDESAVWYDVPGGLHGRDTWWEKILEELTARKVLIVVLSPEAVLSPWVRDEINLAWSQKTWEQHWYGRWKRPLPLKIGLMCSAKPNISSSAYREGLSLARVGFLGRGGGAAGTGGIGDRPCISE